MISTRKEEGLVLHNVIACDIVASAKLCQKLYWNQAEGYHIVLFDSSILQNHSQKKSIEFHSFFFYEIHAVHYKVFGDVLSAWI